MRNRIFRSIVYSALLILLAGLSVPAARAQENNEPPVKPVSKPQTPLSAGKHTGFGINLFINNFGFGVGGQFRRVISPMSELTFSADITGIRDVSEQTFTSFFGQQVVPNKYQRVLAFPFYFGIKHRFLAHEIQDNFRLYGAAAVGPVLTFIYPYYKDYNNNGYRDLGQYSYYEPVNDFFSGWKDGSTKWGLAGQLKVGVDFGKNFSHLSSVEFGYSIYYFGSGIQVMDPNRPLLDNQGQPVGWNPPDDLNYETVSFYKPEKYFGTPQISFTFGWMW